MIYINNINTDELSIDRTFIISDFDRTFTTYDSMTSWNLFARNDLVEPMLKVYNKNLFNYYRAIELNDKLTTKEKSIFMKRWAIQELELFKKHGINQALFNRIIEEDTEVILRDDIVKFATRLNELGIKLYIVSGGIYDVIHYTLEKNNVLLPNMEIISNHVSFANGKIDKLDGDIIHSCNKDDIKLPISSDEHGLLFGDLPSDKFMGKNYNTLDIIFSNIKTEYEDFDITLTTGSSFDAVGKLLIKNYK